MLLPFEGTGVDTSWELRMPKAANQFDYSTIADVLLTIEYTALDSFDYRQQVIQTLDTELQRRPALQLPPQFADPWYDLHNPEQTATPMVVRFNTRREDFPPNLDDLRIQHVRALLCAKGRGFLRDAGGASAFHCARRMEAPLAASATSVDGVISTRKGNAGSWTAMLGKSPVGEWELALPNTAMIKNRFKDEQIEDMLFVITYKGHTPAWPA